MKIGEVEKITGLTAKAIRLYEKKSLICVDRTDSDYRDYSEKDVEVLKAIKSFRLAGIGLSRIKLWADGIVSYDELLKQRLAEIDRESEMSEEMYRLCKNLLSHGELSDDSPSIFDETEVKSERENSGKLLLGIDIGTTTVSASVSTEDGTQLEAYNILSDSAVMGDTFSKEQNAHLIADKTLKMIDSLLGIYPGICAIGLSGQMHGILYVDKDGNAVSSLYTWQDERGNEPYGNGRTYAEEVTAQTGIPVSTGYGLVTHFYNMKNDLVPKDAVNICTIMDYVAMRLCGIRSPLVHLSNAASFGLFDVKNGCFDKYELKKIGIDGKILPEITGESKIAGFYRGDITVSVAIGDNQASFLGSVDDEKQSILVNYGT
ncbi:MAG: MerR family transcriptional regulator, partial [Clostridia bacterium]|nr:MerR family transcriptional regulator [Clostridia bacterium]